MLSVLLCDSHSRCGSSVIVVKSIHLCTCVGGKSRAHIPTEFLNKGCNKLIKYNQGLNKVNAELKK